LSTTHVLTNFKVIIVSNEKDDNWKGPDCNNCAVEIKPAKLLPKDKWIDSEETYTTTVVAEADFRKAKLTVIYWWTKSGKEFNVETVQYQVTANGQTNGDLFLAIAGLDKFKHLTGKANQDGEWHDITERKTYESSSPKEDVIQVKYIYDRDNSGDPTLWGDVSVKYVL